MTHYEAQFHSFVIRIRKEPSAYAAAGLGWSGQITHVPSGDQRYVKSMDEIRSFIALYLDDDERQVGLLRRLRHWLARRRLLPPQRTAS
jgi:hypothetical protein